MNQPWADGSEQVLAAQHSDERNGLSRAEAARRFSQSGPNRLVKPREISFGGVFWEEVREPMILLLLFVVVVFTASGGEPRDAITIFIIIILLVLTEILTEYRAKKAIAALRKLAPPTTPVLRDGRGQTCRRLGYRPRRRYHPRSRRTRAGGRTGIESLGLEADESPLTGESVTVAKEDRVLPPILLWPKEAIWSIPAPPSRAGGARWW